MPYLGRSGADAGRIRRGRGNAPRLIGSTAALPAPRARRTSATRQDHPSTRPRRDAEPMPPGGTPPRAAATAKRLEAQLWIGARTPVAGQRVLIPTPLAIGSSAVSM